MDSSFDQSVSLWIRDLKGGDNDAIGKLWAKYFERLVRTAGRKLADVPKRMADEEDVALSAFHSLCRGAQAGRFDLLQDRDDLWRLLVAIASRKAVDQMRRQTSQKRGGGAVRGESVVYTADGEAPAGFAQFVSSEPTPEFIALVDEQERTLLAQLRDDTSRQIARLRLEGYANEEIAAHLGISVRTVERKLGLIRSIWSEQALTDV